MDARDPRKLIGSYWSSFTDVAGEIGRIETLIVRKNQRSESGEPWGPRGQRAVR